MNCIICGTLIESSNSQKTLCSEECYKLRKKYLNKRYMESHAQEMAERKRCYYNDHREEMIARQSKYHRERYKNNVNYKLQCILRCRLNKALKNNYKTGSAVRDLGCSIEEFKGHIERLFQPGMFWHNHGIKGWHIDHIIPLSSFDLGDENQLKEACHYTNLQPLWCYDNLRKSNKIG